VSGGFDAAFFLRPAPEVARALLGALLLRELPAGRLLVRIVETEAYTQDDPACHAVREIANGITMIKQTARNAALFGPPGHAYVYFTYGNHFMFNVVTQPEGIPGAVLIRAAEPLEGLETMLRCRHTGDPRAVTSGPGKLAQALAIDRAFDGHDLALPPLRLLPGNPLADADVVTTTRIGLTRATDRPWRFYERGNAWVSRK
jgi:DNA-3-methyladenine glycosylase